MGERSQQVLRSISKSDKGIEIGPWFAPLAPKREGFNCLTLDVFDGATLRDKARGDPNIPQAQVPLIEEVDLLGTSTEIAQLVASKEALGSFDYVVSSHNFEHLPNPIKFLRGCGEVLKLGGLVTMAIPDRRTCFDHFRPNSRLSEWIEADLENRKQPTLAQQFDHASLHALDRGGSFKWEAVKNLKESYEDWLARKSLADTPYRDTHCWTFTPLSFEDLITEAFFLGLIPFEPLYISANRGNEFFVQLKNVGYANLSPMIVAEFYERRQALLEKISLEPSDPVVLSRGKRFRKKMRAVSPVALEVTPMSL